MDSRKRLIHQEDHHFGPTKRQCCDNHNWPTPSPSLASSVQKNDTEDLKHCKDRQYHVPETDLQDQKNGVEENKSETQRRRIYANHQPLKGSTGLFGVEDDVEEIVRRPCCSFKDTVSKLVGQWEASSVVYTLPGSDESYRYAPISTDQIRLVVIAPGNSEDDILASLVTVDDTTRNREAPRYEALSYVWGDATAMDRISIQLDFEPAAAKIKGENPISHRCHLFRKKLSIRSNLTQALKALRKPSEPRVLWIDAISINQSNVQERNIQVAKMGEIYRSAQNVCVWLDTDTIDRSMPSTAMDFIPELIESERSKIKVRDKNQMFKYVDLLELMNRPWFTRRWVVQEIAYAKKATIHSGEKSVDWKRFQDCVAIMNCYYADIKPTLMAHLEEIYPAKDHWLLVDTEIDQLGANRLINVTSDLLVEKKDGTLQRTKSLEALVCFMQGYETSDPRDVYNSIRGLAADSDLPVTDYSLSIFETYRQVIQHCVKKSKSLDVLCRRWAQDPFSSTSPRSPTEPAIPSWILRGRDAYMSNRKTFVGLPGQTTYATCGKGPNKCYPVIEFPGPSIRDGIEVPNTSVLVRGVAIGHITTCTEPMTDNVIPGFAFESLGWPKKKSNRQIIDVPDKLWRTLAANRGPNGTAIKAWYHRAAHHLLNSHLQNGHLNIDRTLSKTDGYAKVYLDRVKDVIHDRTFFQASPFNVQDSTMLAGLGPADANEGDLIAIVYGLSVPVVLRPVYGSWSQQEYMFIGEAYIDGLMEGEVFESTYEETSFKLI